MVRDAVRQFVEAEIAPLREELEYGDTAALRRAAQAVQRPSAWTPWPHERFKRQIEHERAVEAASRRARTRRRRSRSGGGGDGSITLIPIIELCRYCPGMVTAMGVSIGLTAAAITSKGTDRPEGALGARPAHPREDRRLGHHRARLRLRRLRVDEVHGPPRRRRVRPQRLQDLHHQRPLRRHHRLHLQARRGQPARGAQDPLLRARLGHARPRAVASRCARWACTPRPPASCSSTTCGSAATACIGETEDLPKGGREGAKATFSHGALRRGRHGARHHRGVPRALGPVRQGPGAVRPAHRRVPAHPGQAGPHGGGPPQRAEPGVPLHRDVRGRAAA